jgi:gliding motility-associated-like protein
MSLLFSKPAPVQGAESSTKSLLRFWKKAGLILFLLAAASQLHAQLDTLHYIPPFGTDNGGNERPGRVYIYISTPSATPVNYELTDAGGTTVLMSGTVTAGAADRWDGNGIGSGVAVEDSDLNQPLASGVGYKVVADGPVYANLRVRSQDNAQAGSLTSKGRNGFGTVFRLGSIPNLQANQYKATTFGITATEDNTTVNIDMTGSGVTLQGAGAPSTASVVTVTLDEGESYVMRCESEVDPDNLDGLIGTLITSNRPIVVNTGSWNGEPTTSGGRDYGIDQIVGLSKVGTDYIFIRASGGDDRELPMIVAHYDNTEIFVNGNATPMATIDAGEYFTIHGSNYVGDVMYVRTSQNAFAYQILAGNDAGNTAGMNFVPDISCQIEDEINGIPDVEQIGPDNFNGGVTITTFAGSDIFINGVLETSTPQTITIDSGESYDIYKIPGLTGDQHITSSTIAIVSFYGVSGVAGYGGYYSGFSRPQSVVVSPNPVQADATEGCQVGIFTIERDGDLDVPLEVDITFGGTAQYGVDYIMIDGGGEVSLPISFAPGQSGLGYAILGLTDAMDEGPEDIQITVGWEVCNDYQTSTQTLYVLEPSITVLCPNDTIVGFNPGSCTEGDFFFGTPLAFSGCGVTVSRTDGSGLNSGNAFPAGTTTISYLYSINGGDITETCEYTVTVADIDPPVFTCPNDTTVTASPGLCEAPVTLQDPIAVNDCNGYTLSNDAPALFPVGTTVVTWTAIDGLGNTSSCQQNVIVEDNEAPSLTCTPTVSETAAIGSCDAFVSVPMSVATDNCGIVSLINDYNGTNDASDTYPVGNTVVTWTAIDAAGNTTECTTTVTVNGEITCPTDISVSADPGVCEALVSNAGPSASLIPCTTIFSDSFESSYGNWNDGGNDCQRQNSATWANTGSYSVRLRDNSSSSNVTSNVFDATTFGALELSFSFITNNFDNTEEFVLEVSTNGGSSWTQVEEWNHNDEFVNNVRVDDTVEYTGAMTANMAFRFVCNASGNDDQVFIDDIVITGCPACAVIAVTNDFNGGSDASGIYPVGTTTVNWVITYTGGTTQNCTQTVTVTDDEAPQAQCQDATVFLDASGQATLTPADIDNGSSDNCGVANMSLSQTTFDCSDLSQSLTITSTDGYDVTIDIQAVNINPSTMSCAFGYNYTVDIDYDITFSGSNIPANLWTLQGTVGCTPGTNFFNLPNSGGSGTTTSANGWNPNTDCATATPESVGCNTITIQISGPGIPNGFHVVPNSGAIVDLIVEDAAGNTDQCTANVTVIDNLAPTLTCAADMTVPADAAACTANVTVTAPTASDNCGVVSLINDYNGTADASDTYPVGTTTITWTATDSSGNTATCAQTVTVEDNENPVIVCPSDVAEATDAGSCTASSVALGSPTTSDNCGVASVSNDAPATFPIGSTTVTWTVTDNYGNTATCTQEVVVTDDEDPTISCPSDITTSADAGSCFATVALGSATTADNCGVASVSNDAPAQFPIGSTTVTWTVTDNYGNTATCTQEVVVTDDEDPTIACPSDIAVSADAGSCFATVALGSATTADNCGVASVTNDAPAQFPIGSTTVTWTVTDNDGNTATCTQEVVVTDDEDPTIACPSDIAVSADAGSCFATVALGSATTADNCGVASVSNDAPATFPIGSTTVTWTVTDNYGNTATCAQEVVVTDDEDPTISCPADIAVSADAGSCFATVALGSATTADNCGVASVSNDAPATFPIGSTTVTWTVTDNYGNTATCTQEVVVTDDEDPTISCPADIAVSADAGSCFATVALGSATTADNCGVASVVNDAPATFPIGSTTVTWTVTDDYGNTATCTQEVVVTDDEDPTISCPADIAVSADAGSCFATVALGSATTADNCGVASVTNDAPATFPIGSTTVTWTVTDDYGNTATCTQEVVVTDDEDPTIACPADIAVSADAGSCFATVALGSATTADNCGVASVTNDAPAQFPIGSTTVTWTVTDNYGNTATCTQEVVVTDDENPTIACPADIAVSADAGSCFATVALGSATTADNCGVASVSNDAPATFPIGSTTVTWTVTDDYGNTATCTQEVVVTDDENPTIACPADIAVSADAGSCFATVALGSATTADNCGVASVTNDAPAQFPIGSTTVTWTVTDNYGNTATCTQEVVVTDDENPTIACPADIAVSADAGSCFATVALGSATTADNCGVASVSNDAPAQFPIGSTTVTWTVTDNYGNTATCTQEVVVTDDEDPTIACPADISVSADAGSCFATVALGSPVTNDNCGVASVVNDAPATFPIGSTTVTWTVTDNYGNTATCTQEVVVTDDEDPTISCPADIAVSADAGSCFATVALGSPVTNDNCGVASVSNDAPATFPIGSTTVTWTVTDDYGNTVTCTQEVVVTDDEDPTISCPADLAVSADAGSCFATVALGSATTADNCGVASVSNDAPAQFPIGSTTVTWTVTDNYGNTATCTQEVVVTDDEDPTIACPADISVSADAGSCFATVALGSPVTNDNCGVASVVNDAPATFPIGSTTVTWTVTDNYGNTATCTQEVVVSDDEDPTISCPADIAVSADAGSCFATVALGSATTADNCGVASVSNDAPATFPIGSTTVTWTVTDDYGNTVTCTQEVVVTDDEDPTISCPADIAVSADAGSCFATVALGSATTADNCGVASVSNDAPAQFPIGSTTVTWTVTDNYGNTATCTQEVVVTDDEDPTISCPADLAVSADAGSCFATVVLGSATTADNCGVASVSNDAPAQFPIGSTTVTWTVTDDYGNTVTCTQEVVVTDDEDPTISCPADIAVSADAGSCFATVALGSATTADNCGVASVSNDAPATFPIGSTTVTWTVTDNYGNTATCTQEVVVTDDEDPTISCPADIAVSADAGSCFATVALGSATTADNCGVASVSNDAPAQFPIGSTTVTWTVTDNYGNTATCTQEVVVTDDEDPTISCPADLAVSADAGSCFATVALGSATTADNCGVASVSNDAPAQFPIGSTTVTWTVTDDYGNTATCTQEVVVTDDENPTISCPADIAVSADAGSCFATVALGSATTADNCGVASVSNDAPATFPIGSTTVTWTVTDNYGNTATCTQEVVVTDDEDPTIACPADIAVSADAGSCFATVALGSATTADNCGVASVTNDAPATFPIGSTIVTWTVTDDYGNTATCTQEVVVTDDEAPVITCPSNMNVSADADCQFTLVDYTALAVSSDNCDAVLTINQSPAAGTTVSGTTTVTLTATDAAGNSTDCTFDLIVEDTDAPVIVTCAPNTTLQLGANCEATLPDYTLSIVATDNCDTNPTISQSPAAGSIVSGHTTVVPVTITVTDANGNSTECFFDVTLDDAESPVVTCAADVAEATDAGSCFATITLDAPAATDNCAIASVTNDAPATFPIGATTVTWTVTDIAGNVTTCEQVVTVSDTELPTIACPADITTSADAGSCFATVALGSPVTDDNCGVASVVNDAPAQFPIGSTTVTWTVTDNYGNTATCTQEVVVTDNENPTIVCPADIAQTADAGSCFATVALGSPVTDDNCGVASVVNDAPATFPIGSTTVTWTVTDNYGNTATCAQEVVVTDDENPTITCPADIAQTADAGSCFATIALGSPVTDDNCGVASVSNDAPATFPIGSTTVTWTVTDNYGNTATCTQEVVVTDDENPTIVCPADITQTADAGSCFATVALGSPVTDDNCGVASVVNDAPATFPIGSTTVIWTVTDNYGNTATCAQEVVVTDDENPTITCPADIAQTADAGSCFATVALGSPVTDDNCGVASVVNDAPATFPIGSTTVTWTVTDNYGNTATCTQEVVVTDDENPTITCPADIAATTDAGSCFATVALGTPATNDNCVVASVVNDAPAQFPIGSTIVTWTVTDNYGNTATCTQEVVVTDDEAPVIDCPADMSVSADANCEFTLADYTSLAVSSDNCDAVLTITQSPAAGTVVAGTTTVTLTATDAAGNSTDCTFDLIVEDTDAPVIVTCAPNTTLQLGANCEATLPDYTLSVVATDNCDNNLTISQSPAAGTIVSGHGSVVNVTVTVTDANGNSTQCFFDVTLEDSVAPVVSCAADVAEATDAGSCFATITLDAPTADDNCAIASVTNDAPATFPIGSTIVTWTVTDIAGNVTTCEQLVTVTDNELPTIACPADITQTADAGSCFATVALGSPATDDNCGVASVVNDAPAQFPIGSTIVTWTVTDNNGNTATCTQEVVVTDDENPTITCPADIAATTDAGSCFATVALGTPVTDDNCGVASVSNDAPATFAVGSTTVTWTVTDNYGNTATCTQEVVVTDDEDPTITCPADIAATTDAGSCFATVVLGTPVTDDNCGVASVSNDAPATFPIGSTIVTWTVVDNNGNTVTCTQEVVVTDDEDPTITCPADITSIADAGSCFATVALGSPATDDNCGVASVVNDAPAQFPIGSTIVTWTVTDNNGNTATCTQEVVVTDDENPTITCPADIAVTTDAGSCFATVALGTPVTDDNCGVASVSNDAPATFAVGSTTVTWTVTDNYGNTVTCIQEVVVTDDEDPTITCPADIAATTDAGSCFATVALGTPVTDDNCGVASVSNDAPATFPIGSTIVTWTVVDNNGNTVTCTQEVVVTDDEDPTITCPTDITSIADAGSCFATVALGSPATDDNCGVASVVNDAPAQFPIGSTIVTWTVTDNNGNTATCTQEVIVTDDEDPTITCPADIAATTDAGSCFATVALGTPVTDDNCGVASVSNDAPATFAVGSTTVTWTVIDNYGNTATCTQEVVVTDDEDPTITCPADIAATTDAGSCFATVSLGTPVTDDNCGVASVSNDAPATFPIGSTIVTWTVVDNNGNAVTCTQEVVVTDDENPTITCEGAVTIDATVGSCDTPVSIALPITDDNCTVASVVNDYNGTADASDVYSVGTTTVTWTVTDAAGNTSTCVTTVTVLDAENPTITCPSDITQTADAGVCEAFVSIAAPVADDNCGVASVVNDYNGSADATDVYPVGSTTIIWTVTDLAGNTATCEQTIVITDDEAPVITCPDDLTVSTDAGVCEANVSIPPFVADDNCAIATIENDYNGTADASNVYPQGVTTVNWTVTDIHGNVSTCSMTVTVEDNEAPAVECPADLVVSADAGVCEADVSIPPFVAEDNCGIASVINDLNGTADASGIYPLGVTTLTWTITDVHGNVTTCVQTVTVEDNEAPSIVCPEDQVELVDDNCAFILPDYTALATAADNCDADLTLTQSPVAGTQLNGSGTTQEITLMATDDSGNSTSCTFIVTLDDVIAPEITCVADQTLEVNEACEVALPDYTGDALTSDNCTAVTVTQDPVAGTVLTLGVEVITLTATDEDGNVTTCTFNVEVIDTTAPVIECPEDQVEALTDDCDTVIGDYLGLVTANDNCSAVALEQSPVAGTVITENTEVTVTAMDDSGNVTTCSFMVVIDDAIAPVIECEDDIEITAEPGVCGATVNYTAPVATDNCTVASVVLTEGLNSGEFFPVGSTVVTWEVTDGFGNTASCSFTVTVTDDEAPAIACPEDILLTADAGQCGAIVNYDMPTATDNCGVSELSLTEGFASGGFFSVGETTVTYMAIDDAGNTSECSFTVTITDDEAPLVTDCPTSIEVNTDAGECGAVVDFTVPTATDNCGNVEVELISGQEPGSFFDTGVTEVSYLFTDDHGNSTLCAFTITVVDAEAPTFDCPENLTVANTPGICGAEFAYELPEASDNCAIESVVLTEGLESGDVFPIGTTTLTFEATDASGNTVTCSYDVTVEDTEAPVIECPEDIVTTEAIVEYDLPIFSDNCGATLTMIEGLESGDVFPHGYTEVVFVATDEAGNSVSCSFLVLVNNPPVGEDDEDEFFEEDTEITIDVIDNDWDPDGDPITISDAEADNGFVDIVDDQLIYSPADGWCGTDTITYIVCDIYNACDTAIVVVEVECFIDLIIPEGISPNGDGVNDTFEIVGLEDYPDNHISIYNRWGRLVYESSNYQNDWDGRSQDALTLGTGLLPEGTYFMVLELGGDLKPVKGYVYLNH